MIIKKKSRSDSEHTHAHFIAPIHAGNEPVLLRFPLASLLRHEECPATNHPHEYIQFIVKHLLDKFI